MPGMQNAEEREKAKNDRLAAAKNKNEAFQMFDKMLGLGNDPKLNQIRD